MLIEQAIHAELAVLMAAFSKDTLEDGRARLVRQPHRHRQVGAVLAIELPVHRKRLGVPLRRAA